MNVEKTFQGAWRVSAIVRGYLMVRQYFGLTKREAVAAFLKEARESAP